MAMGSVVADLLREAEAELARLRAQRGELDRAERLASERVAHLRALVELEVTPTDAEGDGVNAREPTFSELTADDRAARRKLKAAASSSSDMRPEDIAADLLSERGPLHYRDLWEEVARRGGNIVSGNPAAVLLTRISRDDRFAKAEGRGIYRLIVSEEPVRTAPTRRRRKGRRRAKKKVTPAVPE